MDYEYDIFISYRRIGDEWDRWTTDIFVRLLRLFLRPSGKNIKIFVDKNIETGAHWPTHLSKALAHSRILIPVLSPDYFKSEWCRLELALMHHRAQQHSAELILPFTILDDECFPPEVQALQSENIYVFANPIMNDNTPTMFEFAEYLKKCCPRILSALEVVPKYCPDWEKLAHDQFIGLFEIKTQAQTTVPVLSLPIPTITSP